VEIKEKLKIKNQISKIQIKNVKFVMALFLKN
jgi:hypothetical protein